MTPLRLSRFNTGFIYCGLPTLFRMTPSSITAKTQATAGEEHRSFDGEWFFTINPKFVAADKTGWTNVSVPGNWDALPQFSRHRCKGWYRRTFEVP